MVSDTLEHLRHAVESHPSALECLPLVRLGHPRSRLNRLGELLERVQCVCALDLARGSPRRGGQVRRANRLLDDAFPVAVRNGEQCAEAVEGLLSFRESVDEASHLAERPPSSRRQARARESSMS
jgi:hypothetical protein